LSLKNAFTVLLTRFSPPPPAISITNSPTVPAVQPPTAHP
jgi:hypothetical protein